MNTDVYLIYKYTNSINGKSYIGQTNDMSRRRSLHKSVPNCPAFHRAIVKYGFESFIEEILYNNLTLEQSNLFEKQSIKEHNTLVPYGYNIKTGGKSGGGPSAELRLQISKKLKGRKVTHLYRSCSIDGTVYESITQAANDLNKSVQTCYKRLKSNNPIFNDWIFLNKDINNGKDEIIDSENL